MRWISALAVSLAVLSLVGEAAARTPPHDEPAAPPPGVRSSRSFSVDLGFLGINGPVGIFSVNANYNFGNYLGLELAAGMGYIAPYVATALNLNLFGSGNHALLISPGMGIAFLPQGLGVLPARYPNFFVGYQFQGDNGLRVTAQVGWSAVYFGAQLLRIGHAF